MRDVLKTNDMIQWAIVDRWGRIDEMQPNNRREARLMKNFKNKMEPRQAPFRITKLVVTK